VIRRWYFPALALVVLADAIISTFFQAPSPDAERLALCTMVVLAVALCWFDVANRRLRIRAAAAHPGIRLRITNEQHQAPLEADSDMLHWIARFGGADGDGWVESFRTDCGLVVEMKPVMLPNPAGEVL
jgi:hypothetical protein